MVKNIHIVSAIIFMGNILISAYWMYMARRKDEVKVLQFAVEIINLADFIFTIPSIILLFISGLLLTNSFGGIFGASWVVVSLVLLAASGMVWLLFLLRYQFSMVKIAKSQKDSAQIKEEIKIILNKWFFWGIIALITPIFVLVLMLIKPAFW